MEKSNSILYKASVVFFNAEGYFSNDPLIRSVYIDIAEESSRKVSNPKFTGEALKERTDAISLIAGMFLIIGAAIMVPFMIIFGVFDFSDIWIDITAGVSAYFNFTAAVICFRAFIAMRDQVKFKKNTLNTFSPNNHAIPKISDLIPGIIVAPLWGFMFYFFI